MEAGRSPTGRRGRVLPRVKASAQRPIVRWGCRRGSSGRAVLRLVAGTAGSAGRGSLQTAVYKRRVAVYKRGSLQTCQFASVAVYKRGSLQTARGSLQTWQFTNGAWQFTNGAWQFTNGAWQFTNVAVYKRGSLQTARGSGQHHKSPAGRGPSWHNHYFELVGGGQPGLTVWDCLEQFHQLCNIYGGPRD